MNGRGNLERAAVALGAVFVLVGILGFVPYVTTEFNALHFSGPDSNAELLGVFEVSTLHNFVHIAFGVLGISAAKSFDKARLYLTAGGAVYLVLFLYGLFVGMDSEANFVPVNDADYYLHLFLAITMVAAGLALGRRSTQTAGTNTSL